MCFRRNKYDDFEQWCDAINELPYGTNLAFSEYRKGDQITPEDRGAGFHEAVIKLINAD